MNCWPSGKYVQLLYMYSIFGRGSFCFNGGNVDIWKSPKKTHPYPKGSRPYFDSSAPHIRGLRTEPILPIRRICKLRRAPETPEEPSWSQRGFHLVSFLKLASGYENMNDQLFECGALSPSLRKKSVKSCNVNVVQSLAWDKKNNFGRDTVSRVLSVSAIRDGVKRGQLRFIHPFIKHEFLVNLI